MITLLREPAGGLTARLDIPGSLLVEPAQPARVEGAGEPVGPDPAPRLAPEGVAAVSAGPIAAPAATATALAEREAPEAPEVPEAPVVPAGSVTVGGLARRVRGANVPAATSVAAAFGGGEPAVPAGPSTADDVASFLSAFSGGVERGLAGAGPDVEEEQ